MLLTIFFILRFIGLTLVITFLISYFKILYEPPFPLMVSPFLKGYNFIKVFLVNHPKNKSNKIFLLGCTRIARCVVGDLGILRRLIILFFCGAMHQFAIRILLASLDCAHIYLHITIFVCIFIWQLSILSENFFFHRCTHIIIFL